MEEWLSNYVEIELEKSKPKTTLDRILKEGYIVKDINLRHFIVYEKDDKRILYNPLEKTIDMIYNVKDIFNGVSSSSNSIEFEIGEEEE